MSNDQSSLTDDEDSVARRVLYVSLLSRLCDDVLPDQAQDSGEPWPVRFDHCFRRLAYDAACGREWTDAVDRPFTENAPYACLKRATDHAIQMRQRGRPYAERLQEKSLVWRGEMDPEEAETAGPETIRKMP